MKRAKYIIIGGGISGLSFAFNKRGEDYLVLEKEKVCGGLARSFYQDGFVWDVAGHFFHFHSHETKDMYEKLMGNKQLKSVVKCAKVFYSGQYIDAPFQYNIHQLPINEFVDCLTDLYYTYPCSKNVTFEEYVKQTYGNGIAEKFLIPYNEKLYACHLNELEKDSMGSFLPSLDFNMLMEFLRGRKGKTYNDIFSYPIKGCCEIINSLLENLDSERIHKNEQVLNVNIEKKIISTTKDPSEFANTLYKIKDTIYMHGGEKFLFNNDINNKNI